MSQTKERWEQQQEEDEVLEEQQQQQQREAVRITGCDLVRVSCSAARFALLNPPSKHSEEAPVSSIHSILPGAPRRHCPSLCLSVRPSVHSETFPG